jgi:predicted phosphodiesterase
MKKPDFNAIALADLHFGPTNNPAEIYTALQKVVYPYIKKTLPDVIIICGDDTDERLDLSQLATRFYLQFVHDIAHFKKDDGSPIAVRWVSGTESHTKNQLQSLYYLAGDTTLNVKLFETVTEEKLNGYTILYVPEESITSKKDHYKDTLYGEKQYDYAFGHGMFEFVSFSRDYNAEKSLRGAPIFTTEEFRRVVKQLVVFGHIHIAQNYQNFIYYPGSLTRFRQGENNPKGFLHIYNNNVTFIENPYTKQYITGSIAKKHRDDSVETLIAWCIGNTKDEKIADFRVLVGRNELEPSKLLEIKNYFQQHPEYRVRIELRREVASDDIVQNGPHEQEGKNMLHSKYPEIVDPNEVVHNTINYCKEALSVIVTQEQIEYIVSKAKSFEDGTLG